MDFSNCDEEENDDDLLLEIVASRARAARNIIAASAETDPGKKKEKSTTNTAKEESAVSPTLQSSDSTGRPAKETAAEGITPGKEGKDGALMPAENIINDDMARGGVPMDSFPGAFAIAGPSLVGTQEQNRGPVGPNGESVPEHVDEEAGITLNGSASGSSSALVEAQPAIPVEDLARAEPVDIAAPERKSVLQSMVGLRRHLPWIFLAVGIILVVSVIVGIKANGTGKNEFSSTSATELPSPTLVPSKSEPMSAAMEIFIESLPDYTLASLADPFSGQSLAFEWLSQQDIADLPLWRHRQLFALAVYYFYSNGPNWPFGLNKDWLDLSNNRTECDWFSGLEGIFLNGGFKEVDRNRYDKSCNDNGEFQTLCLGYGAMFGNSMNNAIVPKEISLLSALKHIILGHNGLSNTTLQDMMPPQIFEMTTLESLIFFDEPFTGTMPTKIGLLTNLVDLGFWKLDLSGPIPTELGLLNNLQNMLLGGNSFTGRLPTQLAQATDLQVLSINGSSLVGSIPDGIMMLPNLTFVDLSNSFLTGTLPYFESMTSLEVLDLKNTLLSGSFPVGYGTLVGNYSLRHVVLSNTSLLTGTIPDEMCTLNGDQDDCVLVHPYLGSRERCVFEVSCSDQLCGCGCAEC